MKRKIMKDYTKKIGFWLRLKDFVLDIQTNCPMGEEEKEMILYNCNRKISDIEKNKKVKDKTVIGKLNENLTMETEVDGELADVVFLKGSIVEISTEEEYPHTVKDCDIRDAVEKFK